MAPGHGDRSAMSPGRSDAPAIGAAGNYRWNPEDSPRSSLNLEADRVIGKRIGYGTTAINQSVNLNDPFTPNPCAGTDQSARGSQAQYRAPAQIKRAAIQVAASGEQPGHRGPRADVNLLILATNHR